MMSDTQYESDDDDLVETCRVLADVIDAGHVRVDVTSTLLRQIADELVRLREAADNTIVVQTRAGEELAVFRGEEADRITHDAVEEYVRAALDAAIHGSPSRWRLP